MALSTPTIIEIKDNIKNDIESKINQTIPANEKAVFNDLAFALSGAWLILYKFGTDEFKQRFVQTANDFWLGKLGEIVNIFRQQATTWSGEAEVESTVDVGTLDAGTQLVNNNTGAVYFVKESITLSIGINNFNLDAAEGGALSNLEIGDIIDFVSPLPGLADTIEITDTFVVGEDQEDIEVFRQRVLDAYQKKPQGGASADYEQWGEEAPNVINVYPYAAILPGQVDVFVEVDNQTDGIPTTQQLEDTLDFINFDPITGRAIRRPTTAEIFTFAITRITFDVEIAALSPDKPEIRADIDAAITENLLLKEPFILGLSITRNDTITEAGISSVAQTVAAAAGSTISGVKVYEGLIEINLRVLEKGEKSKVGTIIYT